MASEYPKWLRVDPDDFDLSKLDPRDRRGPDGEKIEREVAEAKHLENLEELKHLQYLLYAESKRSVLVVLQATDTGGKDGAIRKTFGALNPAGVTVHPFGKPSEEELAHDYLWRIHHHTPQDGHITIFNRSHYEDVLVVRVHDLVPKGVWSKRYKHIRNFEEMLYDEGTTVIKFFLNISKDEQKERLQARLDDPERHWKFNVGDLAERELWDDYREAFEVAMKETSTDCAPWYAIPADRKWFRNYAISTIVLEHLRSLDMKYPEPEEGLDDIVIE